MKGTKPYLVVDNDAVTKPPAAPSWLSPDAKREWRRVLPPLVKRRILTIADLGSLENYCIAIGLVREMQRRIDADGAIVNTEHGLRKHPAVQIQADAMTRARLLAAELGLTPVSRSRPSVRADTEDDDFATMDL